MRAEAVKTFIGVTAGSTFGMSWLEAKIEDRALVDGVRRRGDARRARR